MYKDKPVSIFSIMICMIVVAIVTTALVVSVNNSNEYRASLKNKDDGYVYEQSAYVKVYTQAEIERLARQAFVDNYVTFYDGIVDVEGLEALVVGDVSRVVPEKQLDNYLIVVTDDTVDVFSIV